VTGASGVLIGGLDQGPNKQKVFSSASKVHPTGSNAYLPFTSAWPFLRSVDSWIRGASKAYICMAAVNRLLGGAAAAEGDGDSEHTSGSIFDMGHNLNTLHVSISLIIVSSFYV
jgi:hypothetical protein